MQIYICETTREDDKGTSNCETRRENVGEAMRDGRTGRRIRNGYEKRFGSLRKKRLNGLRRAKERHGERIN